MSSLSIKDKNASLCQFFSFMIVFLVIANVYAVPFAPSLGVGELVFIIYAVFLVLSLRINQFRLNSWVIVFSLYSIVVTLVMCVVMDCNIQDPMYRIVRDSFYYFVIFFLGAEIFSIDSFSSVCLKFVKILSIFVILQFTCYILFGRYYSGIISGLPLKNGVDKAFLVSKYSQQAHYSGYLRPNGFLLEPSDVAKCLSIGEVLLLFGKKQKSFFWPVMLTIALFMTVSVSAFAYITVIWAFWFLVNSQKKHAKAMSILLAFVVAAILAVLYYMAPQVFDVFGRISSILQRDAGEFSAQLRLFNGFELYSTLPIENKLFGIGFGNFTNAVSSNVIAYSTTDVSEYMNSFSYLLISCGIMGTLLYVFLFVRMFIKKKSKMVRITIILLFLMLLSASIYSSPMYVWLLCIIFYCKEMP